MKPRCPKRDTSRIKPAGALDLIIPAIAAFRILKPGADPIFTLGGALTEHEVLSESRPQRPGSEIPSQNEVCLDGNRDPGSSDLSNRTDGDAFGRDVVPQAVCTYATLLLQLC